MLMAGGVRVAHSARTYRTPKTNSGTPRLSIIRRSPVPFGFIPLSFFEPPSILFSSSRYFLPLTRPENDKLLNAICLEFMGPPVRPPVRPPVSTPLLMMSIWTPHLVTRELKSTLDANVSSPYSPFRGTTCLCTSYLFITFGDSRVIWVKNDL